MKRWSFILLATPLLLLLMSCGADGNDYSDLITRKHASQTPTPPAQQAPVSMDECEDYVILASASLISDLIGKPRDWVKRNYLIPIYADTSKGGHRVIGHAPVGAHCFIIKNEEEWFFIQSPYENELGWLHRDYIAGFIKKDPHTLLPCRK